MNIRNFNKKVRETPKHRAVFVANKDWRAGMVKKGDELIWDDGPYVRGGLVHVESNSIVDYPKSQTTFLGYRKVD